MRSFCSALSFCLTVTDSISLNVLKSLYKNLLWNREGRASCPQRQISHLAGFSSLLQHFASSSASLPFFQPCHIAFSVPSFSPLICLCLSWNQEIPASSDWKQKLLWRLWCPTKPDDKAGLFFLVFFAGAQLLTTSVNIIICKDLLRSLVSES